MDSDWHSCFSLPIFPMECSGSEMKTLKPKVCKIPGYPVISIYQMSILKGLRRGTTQAKTTQIIYGLLRAAGFPENDRLGTTLIVG